MKPIHKFSRNNEPLVFPEIPTLFDDFFLRDLFNFPFRNQFQKDFLPSLNVNEENDCFILELAVPGIDKKRLKVELKQATLIISAKHEEQKEKEYNTGNYRHKEFSYQSFERMFELSEDNIMLEAITATYKNGVLYVKIPKRQQTSLQEGKLIYIN